MARKRHTPIPRCMQNRGASSKCRPKSEWCLLNHMAELHRLAHTVFVMYGLVSSPRVRRQGWIPWSRATQRNLSGTTSHNIVQKSIPVGDVLASVAVYRQQWLCYELTLFSLAAHPPTCLLTYPGQCNTELFTACVCVLTAVPGIIVHAKYNSVSYRNVDDVCDEAPGGGTQTPTPRDEKGCCLPQKKKRGTTQSMIVLLLLYTPYMCIVVSPFFFFWQN